MPNVTHLRALLACAALVPAAGAAADPSVDQRQLEVVPVTARSPLAVGGWSHQKLAQVVEAGRAGTLVAIAAPVTCDEASSLVVEIRGVHVDAQQRVVPDADVRSAGTIPGAFLPAFADPAAPDLRMLPLSRPVALAAGERFGFVLSSAGACRVAQAPAGELYPGGDASFIDDTHAPFFEWLWLGLGRLDLPFETWMEPPPLAVRIDVKPGSEENPVNLGARGTIPVAILGSDAFDVRAVDVATVAFAGAAVATDPRGRPRAAVEDVDGDGSPDLVLHFSVAALRLGGDDRAATVTGRTVAPDALEFAASDRVRVVPASPRGAPAP